MVEYTYDLDSVFGCLSDPTRRDILGRIAQEALSIGEIARPYNLTFAAISKHLKVMERARLIIKERKGKEQIVHLSPDALASADEYLAMYRKQWSRRLDALDSYLQTDQKDEE
jgi:DNA-binding transcriptional ArsR family regulator